MAGDVEALRETKCTHLRVYEDIVSQTESAGQGTTDLYDTLFNLLV